MPQIVAIGYIAITVSDLEATCTFYDELFGSERTWSLLPKAKYRFARSPWTVSLLSLHQAVNDVALGGRQPKIGAGDICLR